MSKKGSQTNIIFILWKFEKGGIHFGISTPDNYQQYNSEVKKLDKELVPLINKYTKNKRIIAIAVVPKLIFGFSSQRLAMITLNIIAWIKNVSIEILPVSAFENSAVRDSLCSSMFALPKKFSRQHVPVYRFPPDITPSKKGRRFTIG